VRMPRISRCVFEHLSGWVRGLVCVCVCVCLQVVVYSGGAPETLYSEDAKGFLVCV